MDSTSPAFVDTFNYCKAILERGDSWRAVHNYLVGQEVSVEDREKIIDALRKLEDGGHLQKITGESSRRFDFQKILGFVVMVFGIVMVVMLWDRGWVSTIPFFVIGYGAWAMTGGSKDAGS